MTVKTILKNFDQIKNISGVPKGSDAFLLLEILKQKKQPLLFLGLDDQVTMHLKDALKFLKPDLKIIYFPAWDCLPYDRNSPHENILSQRVKALFELQKNHSEPYVVLTTVNAFLQKVPKAENFKGQCLEIKVGEILDLDALKIFLQNHGYQRMDTVREAGEYAIRGGIIDLYPAGEKHPYRLDLFGDEIESLRSFDPISQHSLDPQEGFELIAASELAFNANTQATFRQNYRAFFGAALKQDSLYAAMSEGQKYPGMIHWLPCFYNALVSFTTYLSEDTLIVSQDQIDQAIMARFEFIKDFYDARQSMLRVELEQAKKRNFEHSQFYYPVPMDSLFVSQKEAELSLDEFHLKKLMPFSLDDTTKNYVDLGAKRGRDFAPERQNPDMDIMDALIEYMQFYQKENKQVIVCAYSKGAVERIEYLLGQHGVKNVVICPNWHIAQGYPDQIVIVEAQFENGFTYGDFAFITEQDIFGERFMRKAKRHKKSDKFIREVTSIQPGELVVHQAHGLGRFECLMTIDVLGIIHDCLKIVYAGDDKLFVPVENLDVLTRYGENAGATLDRLGGSAWQSRKVKVKKKLKDMADELLKIAAQRELNLTKAITPNEGLYAEFISRFSYELTDDQRKAIDQVLDDFRSGKVMDRLICGDVGFGKTEVAMHAAFIAAMEGMQVAIVVPTTILARQHAQNFKARFEGLPIKIAHLSRLVAQKDAKLAKDEIQSGKANVIIGTHALLAESLKFNRLGLVIIDEEQRFGVKQKEKLKALRSDIHVLTLTATPIPRTLQLSLTGVRDLSLIATAPIDRLAIRSFVMPFDSVVIREAILREYYRAGQIYFVCPRLSDLDEMEVLLKELVPEVKIVKAHGQLAPQELENVMSAFDEGKFQVLLATNIVESGLDVVNANTMIIHRADMFGLAQLYQLRGRIGRGKVRGYAYLTYVPQKVLNPIAKKRLEILETLDSLGAGFNLASYDMELRGAGNVLGEEQSGQIREVGVELYQKMLEEVIHELKAERGEEPAHQHLEWVPQLNLGAAIQIPETYIENLNLRLNIYRRISELASQEDIDAFMVEMRDRFGEMPESMRNLIEVISLKELCRKVGIEKIDAGPKGAVLSFYRDIFSEPQKLLSYIGSQMGMLKIRPDQKLVMIRNFPTLKMRFEALRNMLEDLFELLKK